MSGVSQNQCMPLPVTTLCLMHFPGPPTRSCLEEQLMGVLQPHDQQRSQSAAVLQTKPREGLCGMSHITSIRSPEADWVTEQCSGNITKTLLNFCLSLCPFISPSLFLLVCPLLSLPLSPHPSSHELEPAEHATQIQQLLRPSLA